MATINNKIATIILAAGNGTRMKSSIPKVCHKIANRPLLEYIFETLEELGCSKDKIVTIIDPSHKEVAHLSKDYIQVPQLNKLGTAHATLQARKHLEKFSGLIFVTFGDTPLVTKQVYNKMLTKYNEGYKLIALGFQPKFNQGYGKFIIDENNNLLANVEYKDCTKEQKKITLCNSGIMAVSSDILFNLLDKVKNDNKQKEYYLPDIISIANLENHKTTYVVSEDEDEFIGINDRKNLSVADNYIQKRLKDKFMLNGVTFLNPESSYVSYDSKIAPDVIIEPNVYIGIGVSIGSQTIIKANSHLEQCEISEDCEIGPFARIRPQSKLSSHVKVGNFVEIKKSEINSYSKVNHLSYIGDATIGSSVNIGAGTITCNYDGYNKHQTTIGDGVFVGSNTCFVAPVTLASNSMTATGTIVTKNVNKNSLVISRNKQIEKHDFAIRFREKISKKKENNQ